MTLSAFEFADETLERLFKHVVDFVFLISDLRFDGVNFVRNIIRVCLYGERRSKFIQIMHVRIEGAFVHVLSRLICK